jgi:hypothetical protein
MLVATVFDQMNGVGQTTGAKYTGSQVNSTTALTLTGDNVFEANTDLVLKAKRVPDTYIHTVSVFAVDASGNPILVRAYASSTCGSQTTTSSSNDTGSDTGGSTRGGHGHKG